MINQMIKKNLRKPGALLCTAVPALSPQPAAYSPHYRFSPCMENGITGQRTLRDLLLSFLGADPSVTGESIN